jgi:hypothetical protein
MRHTRRIIIGVVIGTVGLSSVGALARATKLTQVGTFAQVVGRAQDRHVGMRRSVTVHDGMAVYAGDMITLQEGGTARVLFKPAARRTSGALFTLQAARADSQEITQGVPESGSRIAFRYDGHYIYTVSGRGVDAPLTIEPISLGAGRLRLRLKAKSALDPTFACRVDQGPYRTCTGSEVFKLRPGTHTVSAWTTSLFGFHGPASTKRVTVKR